MRPRNTLPGKRRLSHTRIVWVIAGVVALLVAAAVLATRGVISHRHVTPAPPTRTAAPSGSTVLHTEFAQLEARLQAVMGIAIAPVGDGQNPIRLGKWPSGPSTVSTPASPAWSTMKVPLVIAALREQHGLTDDMRAAITESDNAAAEKIWASLGDPVTAAHKVEQVLRDYGDPTTKVQSQKTRPEFTAFGQSDWSLENQVAFTSSAVCDSQNAPVFELMSHIEKGQVWGIGVISGSQFKGGWGPYPNDSYLVRQMGVLPTPHGMIAVAVAAQPRSGSFDDGVRDVTKIADWLAAPARLDALPAGECNR
jgi:hypothetical protein